MSYSSYSQLTSSEKMILVTCECVDRVKIFTLLSGTTYSRSMDNFVVGVKNAGTALTSGTLPLSNNQYYFNPTTKTLNVNVGSNPSANNISVTYRLFFSNIPINLPYDLSTGEVVEWEPYVTSIGQIGQQLDDENTGIVLESSSSVTFINTDGRFDNILDRYLWENQAISFYSLFKNEPVTEKYLLFTGVIESKTFSKKNVSFKVKDFVYKLKGQMLLGTFSATDGDILPFLIGTSKRRIYGRADHVKVVSTTANLNGISITGTITVPFESDTLTGAGTLFLAEVSQGDELIFTINGEEKKVSVSHVDSNTSLVVGAITDFSGVGLSPIVKKERVSRFKNRYWHVAGHLLKEVSTLITEVTSANRFLVSSVADFQPGDLILVGSVPVTIRRISGNYIVTDYVVSPLPNIGTAISRNPMPKAFFNAKELIHSRDYTVTTGSFTRLTLNSLAEFNLTQALSSSITLTFTNASRSITTASSTDLTTLFKPRDWVRIVNTSKSTWYEVVNVFTSSIEVSVAFAHSTETGYFYYKNVDLIDENSLITVNCIGLENSSGTWIRTASDAVRDILLNDVGFPSVNEASFTKAKADCDYTLSLVIPENLGEQAPVIRDVITKINDSVFGSLYGNSSQELAYSVFNATKPENLTAILDDDILDFDIQTSQNIINEVDIFYHPYTDVYNGSNAFSTVNHVSSFVNNLIGIKNKVSKTIYLYEQSDAEIISQRLCFFRSLSNSVVTLKSKMNFSTVSVNDKMFLSLTRLMKRFAGLDKNKIGIVTGVKKDGLNCEIMLSDLGNIYTRVMSIAPNTVINYSSSSESDKLQWGYIVDNNVETPNASSEVGLGSNLIG